MSAFPPGSSLALLTDLYELTMAAGYWRHGLAERESVFHLTFRRHPFGGEFTLAAGLEPAMDWLRAVRFTSDDLEYLRGLGRFEDEFLAYLGSLRMRLDVDAVPEGTSVSPHAPVLRVRGALLQAQIVETALLNIVNFQTLIATKAARVAEAAGDDAVLEFGLRRAQGIDGGLAASRAAYVGGCAGTSNVLAGKLFGIPVSGTMAHSWVMAFPDEERAFEAWTEAGAQNTLFLVDTYDTLEGVRTAIRVGRRLREAGRELSGVRLDSGDLAELSRESRRLLDEAGFGAAKIVASGDLDEYEIARLKAAGARIDMWGVGTRLVTAKDDPALSGVYKLGALRDEQGEWTAREKVSDDPEKKSTGGVLQVRRFEEGDGFRDEVYDERDGAPEGGRDLLEPVMRGGELAAPLPTLDEIRATTATRK